MKNFSWAIALMMMLVAIPTSASAQGTGIAGQLCRDPANLPAGAVIDRMSGCAADWGFCQLIQMQLGDSVDACGLMPDGFTWHNLMYAGEFENTRVRIDRWGRPVYVGQFSGCWDEKKQRFAACEDDLFGYEGSVVYKDHKRIGRTILRGDSPPTWSSVLTHRSTTVVHPITAEEVAKLKGDVADLGRQYQQQKIAIDRMERSDRTTATELRDAKKAREALAGQYNDLAGKLAGIERDLRTVKSDVALLEEIVGKMEPSVAALERKGEQNKFYLEFGYGTVGEKWHGVLPGGLLLDIAPSHRILLGAGHQFRSDTLTVRGIVQGGLNLRYDAASAGATVGARVDLFYQFKFLPEAIRLGGSLGLEFDWYHLSHGRTEEGIYSVSASLRLVPQAGVTIDLGETPLTLTILAGVRFGPTWVGVKGVHTPFSRFGGQGGVKFGGRF